MSEKPLSPTASSLAVEAFCLGCGYPLHPLKREFGNCPECGRPFHLADSTTTSRTPNALRLRRVREASRRRFRQLREAYLRAIARPAPWLRPAALAVHVTSIVVSILLLGDVFIPLVILGAGSCCVALAHLPRQIARRRLGRIGQFPAEATKIDITKLHRMRKASLWIAFLLLLRLPFYLIFLINLAAFNGVAHQVDTDPACAAHPSFALMGFFPIRERLVGHGGADFELPTGRTLLYRPAWNADYYDSHVRHAGGRWFVCDLPLRQCTFFGGVRGRHWSD
ncbi:MAG: hypothetical protein JWN40_194 [Phycisphaerales bacterium]|nr:hypothetical protein [Phycisphaerales bacterium]